MSARCILATLVCGLALWAIFLGSLFAVGAFGSCHHSRACWKRVHVKRAHRWCLRHDICIWRHRWNAEEPSWRAWAHRTEGCESGHNPRAVSASGAYRGSMQFDYRTWGEAGGHGDPIWATIFEQRVRAIELARRVGTGRWPICGR